MQRQVAGAAPPTTVELQVWLDEPGASAGQGIQVRAVARPRTGAPSAVGLEHGKLLQTSTTPPVTDASGRLTIEVSGGPEIGIFALGDDALRGEVVLSAAPGEVLQAELIVQSVPLPTRGPRLAGSGVDPHGHAAGVHAICELAAGGRSESHDRRSRHCARQRTTRPEFLSLAATCSAPGVVRILLPPGALDQLVPSGSVEIFMTGREFESTEFRSFCGRVRPRPAGNHRGAKNPPTARRFPAESCRFGCYRWAMAAREVRRQRRVTCRIPWGGS